ncbi:uncharacterized protein AB675_5102 [Cyphellophora attinorum]|uniref:Uncharacterized protein n=1 Tax=Cyphellophora attinorum TaxID=1664694 RepID=A0A0N0NLQ1_9EURO|nr:uncharacterized protein AB675_5102 [Phialophora attinorum]KPI39438.1 hypothetical protein AB675_5102 [Phialophora attinorum]
MDTVLNLLDYGFDFQVPNTRIWCVPAVTNDSSVDLRGLLLILGQCMSSMRRTDTADEMRSWETRFPKSRQVWVGNELYAFAVLKNRTSWVESLLEQGADVAGLDHCGDIRLWVACHSCQDPQIFNILRAKGLKLNDFGPQRENKSATLKEMHPPRQDDADNP